METVTDCAIGSGEGKNGSMAYEPRYTDALFIRMPDGTRQRLERLAGKSPVPSKYLRELLLKAIEAEEALHDRPAGINERERDG